MTDGSNPDPQDRSVLDYRGRDDDRPKMEVRQVGIGFLIWLASVFTAFLAGMVSTSVWFGVLVLSVVLVLASVHFAGRLGWRGFLPGVLIGAALTCLLPLGIPGVFCATHR